LFWRARLLRRILKSVHARSFRTRPAGMARAADRLEVWAMRILRLFPARLFPVRACFVLGLLAAALLCCGGAAPARAGPYRIGAYYFGYWGPSFPVDQLRHYRRVFGRAGDPWSGVRDLHDAGPAGETPLYAGDFRHLKPAIGYYDLSRVATVETQIGQAAGAGLDYFNFYFYWNAAAGGEKYGDGLNSFLQARNRADIGFMLSLVSSRGDSDIPAQDYATVAAHVVETYFRQTNYLRSPDGRLMFEALDTRGIGDGAPEAVDAFLATLRKTARDRLGLDLFVLSSANQRGYGRWRQADGVTCSDHFYFPEGPGALRKPYESAIDAIEPYFDLIAKSIPGNEAILYCVSSGHDERPRLYLNTSANTPRSIEAIRQKLPFYTDRSPQLFRAALARTKALMDASASPLKSYLNVYAWNEWNEGGIVEPNARDGDAYLAAITQVFGLRPRPGARR
jgi:hypothetical protein